MSPNAAAWSHSFDPTVLRAYDIRGVTGETLGPADAQAVGRTFGSVVRRAGGARVAVGWDGRTSSPELRDRLVDGLTATGIDVVRVGRGPSPMLYFAVHHLGADAGIMVTGSHNPAAHNGFKMMLGPAHPGQAFYGEAIQQLGEMAASGDVESGDGAVEDQPVEDAYVERLREEYRTANGLRVVWDAGNGAAGDVVSRLLEGLPGEHHGLFLEIDGSFPNHHPDPTVAENLADLQAAVRDREADLGVAFDGDGDRIGVVDGGGHILWADQLMVLFARDLLAGQPGAPVIADVKASQVLFDEIDRAGGQPDMFKTGHSLIKARMKELGAPFAGEMSGHLFFADRYYGFDDGIYAAVRLIGILAENGQSLADFRQGLPALVNTPEIRFACDDDRKWTVMDQVAEALAADGEDVNTIDGVRVSTEDGWWLLRASNTQPALVARCEASSDAGLSRLKAALASRLEACGVKAPADL